MWGNIIGEKIITAIPKYQIVQEKNFKLQTVILSMIFNDCHI